MVDFLLWEVTLFDFLNRIILVVLGSYLLAWFLQWLLEDFPRLRFYFGLPNSPLMDWSGVPGISRFKLRRKLRNPSIGSYFQKERSGSISNINAQTKGGG